MLGVLAGITAGTNLLGGLIQGIGGAKRARRARQAISNYRRQDLQNAFNGVSVSTLGADLRREEAVRALATVTNASRRMGTRGFGMTTNAMRGYNQTMRQVGADLDQQRRSIDMAVARDDARIRDMQERREEADLAGLGQEYNVGRQEAAQGFAGAGNAIFNTAMMLAPAMGAQNPGQVAPAGSIGTMPIVPTAPTAPYGALLPGALS